MFQRTTYNAKLLDWKACQQLILSRRVRSQREAVHHFLRGFGLDNPYQSPAGGNRVARRFRLGRIVLIAVGLLFLLLGPIVWQATREWGARQRAAENMRQIGEALRQYQAREQTERVAPAEAAEGAEDD